MQTHQSACLFTPHQSAPSLAPPLLCLLSRDQVSTSLVTQYREARTRSGRRGAATHKNSAHRSLHIKFLRYIRMILMFERDCCISSPFPRSAPPPLCVGRLSARQSVPFGIWPSVHDPRSTESEGVIWYKSTERRLNLSRSWHKGHSQTYNTPFFI